MQDGDAIALYKSMRDCLIFLTNLDYEDTESIMLEKLKLQVGPTPHMPLCNKSESRVPSSTPEYPLVPPGGLAR
jgi:hypothetical protein